MNKTISGLLAGLACIAWCGAANAMLISADFQQDQNTSTTFSGVEAAAAASGLFGAASTWNALELSLATPGTPSFGGLVDSTGAATSVGFAITSGTASAWQGGGQLDTLRRDFLFFNSRENTNFIEWELTGLTPGQGYQFYAYYALSEILRNFDLSVDTDGDGSLADEIARNIQNDTSDAFFTRVFADASGRIIGRAEGVGDPVDGDDISFEANWAGFQLATVPEPTTFALFGLGFAGLGWSRRKKA
jgi:hypothetical protein